MKNKNDERSWDYKLRWTLTWYVGTQMWEKFYYKETEYRYVESEDLIYLLNTSEAKENSNRDASKTSKNRYSTNNKHFTRRSLTDIKA